MRKLAAVALLVLLAALPSPAPAGTYKDALIKGVPHVRQKPDFCGEACAEMYLKKLGSKIDQDYVFGRAGLDPALGRGCRTRELMRALTAIGFKTGSGGLHVNTAKAKAEMEAAWKALHADLAKGVPSIVCMHYSDAPQTTEHFRLILGYDSARDEVIYHEPAEDKGAYRRMKRALFLKLWALKYRADRWTLIRMRLQAGKIARPKATSGPSEADYAQHVRKLKQRLKAKRPGATFHIVLQRPFVVVGDEAARTVKWRALRTVKWATDKLKASYFPKDPAKINTIWLFKGKTSYRTGAQALFGHKPSTPFGYCSGQDLVMNIATGGGTLVHEMVHAFMHPNFPACPAWFNEGMGSLYEQCGTKDGKIHGYTNWRLPGLQKAIKAARVPSFKKLCATTTHQFYNKDSGTNYAQARYLCYYLQQNKLLRKFYKAFHKDQKADPSGWATLKKTLGVKDDVGMEKFQKKWEAWVLTLKFGR